MTEAARETGLRAVRIALVAVLFVSIGFGALAAVVAIITDGFGNDEELATIAVMTPIVGTLYACIGLLNLYVLRAARSASAMCASARRRYSAGSTSNRKLRCST